MTRKPLAGLLAAQAVSMTGTAMSLVAIPWLVLDLTGSATALGLVAFAAALPLVVAKAFAGPIIDRYGPRRVSILADLAATGATAAIPLLHHAGGLHLPVLVALAALVGAARGPGDSAKASMVPAVAEAGGTPIERATGLGGAIERLAQMVGPPIAGLLVAVVGPAAILGVDAASFAGAALLLAAATGPGATATATAAERGSYGAELRAGMTFLRGERLLRALVAMMALTNLVDAAVVAVLLPLWASEGSAGPRAVGAVLGGFGATALAGSAVAAVVGPRLRRRPTYLTGQLIGGAPRILVLALGAPPVAVVAVWAIAGCASGFLNPVIGAVTYERIPRPLLGRVLTLAGTAAQGGIPIGPVLVAGLVAGLGLGPVALACGATYLLATTLPLRRPEWREMDHHLDHLERTAS
jgi:MFS family permease